MKFETTATKMKLRLLLLLVGVLSQALVPSVNSASSHHPSLSSLSSSTSSSSSSLTSSASSSASGSSSSSDHGDNRCEEISIPMCRGIGYNYTSMPNQFHHDTQDEAGLEVHQFWPLVEIQCSDDLRFFLCSIYTPICIEDYQGQLPACRSVCERAKQGCAPIMSQYGFQWPERMDCNELPVYGDQEHLCMDSKEGAAPAANFEESSRPDEDDRLSSKQSHIKNIDMSKSKSANKNIKNHQNHYTTVHSRPEVDAPPPPQVLFPESKNIKVDTVEHHNNNLHPTSGGRNCRCDCRPPFFIRIPGSDPNADLYAFHQQQSLYSYAPNHFNHSRIETAGGLAPSCAVSCDSAYRFTAAERETSFFWIGITALVCAITCLLTVLTFLTDSQRFRYPERAIIFLAACYVFIAGGYLMRIRLGHSAIACDGPFIRYQRTGPTPAPCVLSFILLYFFGMASAYWWLILTLTWFLAAGLKWSSEAITSYAQYFHLLAWLLPTAQSVAILCLGAIDGDPFVGVCSVGNQSRANLLIFVITPLCVCIAIGSLFLLAGFIALFRIRRVIRQRQTIRVKTDKLEKLMMRIGFSSFLYIVPEVVVVGCHIYEYINRPNWERSLACICDQDSSLSQESNSPQFALIVLKYIMSLIIGITSGFWIWSSKTVESWIRFYSRVACCNGSFGSPASSRSGASQLLPNMAGYYGRGVALNVGNSSLPLKTQTVNLTPINISTNSTPQHHMHQLAHHHHIHNQHQLHGLDLRQNSNGPQLLHSLPPIPPSIPPSLPPPPPPLMMMAGSHHGGSLTGSQFTHLIGSINGNGSNCNGKGPLSHV